MKRGNRLWKSDKTYLHNLISQTLKPVCKILFHLTSVILQVNSFFLQYKFSWLVPCQCGWWSQIQPNILAAVWMMSSVNSPQQRHEIHLWKQLDCSLQTPSCLVMCIESLQVNTCFALSPSANGTWREKAKMTLNLMAISSCTLTLSPIRQSNACPSLQSSGPRILDSPRTRTWTSVPATTTSQLQWREIIILQMP